MLILAPIAAGLLQMSLSRSREYQADESGAHLAARRRVAGACTREDRGVREAGADGRAARTGQAYIVNPLTGRKVEFANLFSTHPPTAERIARLRSHQY